MRSRAYIGKYSRQFVFRACGYWLWHYFGSTWYNAKANVAHFRNCKSRQHCVPRWKSAFHEHQASRNTGAASEGFLCVFYGDMTDSVDVKRDIVLRTIAKQKMYADVPTLSPTSAAARQNSFQGVGLIPSRPTHVQQ